MLMWTSVQQLTEKDGPITSVLYGVEVEIIRSISSLKYYCYFNCSQHDQMWADLVKTREIYSHAEVAEQRVYVLVT